MIRMSARTMSVWIQVPPHGGAAVLTDGPVAYHRPRPKYPRSHMITRITMMSSMSPIFTSARSHIG